MKYSQTIICLILIYGLTEAYDSGTSAVAEFQIENTKYTKQMLSEFKGYIHDMAVSYRTGNLYLAMFKDESYQAFMLKKGKSKIEAIPSIREAQCALYDPKNDKVYFGSDNGLKLFNEDTETVTDAGFDNYDIWDIAYSPKKDEIIFADFDTKYIHAIPADRNSTSVMQKVENILAQKVFIDGKENVYFYDINGKLRVVFNEFPKSVTYQGLKEDVIAIDNLDNVYIAEHDHIFQLTKDNVIPKVIAFVDFTPSSFVFDDKRNMYFGLDDAIIKYSATSM